MNSSDAAPPPAVSAVVPVYNSADNVEELVRRLAAVLGEHAAQWEVVLVNDGSRDASWAAIEAAAAGDPRVRGLDLMRNYGQHNALLAGLRAARHEVLVTLDDDLQNPPEEIPRLLAALTPERDAVYGVPAPGGARHGPWRDLASRLAKWVLHHGMRAPEVRQITAFRAFRAPVLDASAGFSGPFVSLDALLTWGTTRFAAVPVRHDERRIGRSNYTFGRLVAHTLNLVAGFSAVPLRLASLLGLVFALFGLGVLVYVVVTYFLWGGGVAGFPFLASIIAIFSGVQLVALGVLGEYLARIHFRTMSRPAYTVRRTTPAGGGAG
jgi:undecaprenyl-phosphate 4-deoxy-4-formamido-L-arabinose transferase